MIKKKVIVTILLISIILTMGQAVFAATSSTVGDIYKNSSSSVYTLVYGTTKVVPVIGVSMSKTSITFVNNRSVTLRAIVAPENATNQKITWSTSNISVAAVNSLGIVTPVGKGVATITATTQDGNKTATCSVVVTAQVAISASLVNINVDKSNLVMKVKDTYTLKAIITPTSSVNTKVNWLSSDTKVATVSNSGTVTATGLGSASIFAATGSKIAVCFVQVVVPLTVKGVALSTHKLSMVVGNSYKMSATLTPSNAYNKSVTWSSSNYKVATIDSNGIIIAKMVGKATITVKTSDAAKTDVCYVTVTAPIRVTSVYIDKTSATMKVNSQLQLKATVNPTTASNRSVTWSVLNPLVATVDISGKITAKKAGSTTIYVKTNDGSKTAKCTITVTN